jgi:palmitoyl-protein thioesterase
LIVNQFVLAYVLFVMLLFLWLCSLAVGLRPVVLMHGISADAHDMDTVAAWIQADAPGTYVVSVSVGGGRDEKRASWSMGMNEQVRNFNAFVVNDTKLSGGFNLLGYSQGGLIGRAYIERFNDPPVHNFVTWCTPHQVS